jgi:hypothetical protein
VHERGSRSGRQRLNWTVWRDGGAGAGQRADEGGAALAERSAGVVVIAEGVQVEGDDGSRRLLGEHPHSRIGWVDALVERLEVEAAVGGDDDFAVDHAALVVRAEMGRLSSLNFSSPTRSARSR